MTAETKDIAPTPAPSKPVSDLTVDLQLVAQTAEAVHADGYREPGEIAADDVGASRLATGLDRKITAVQGRASGRRALGAH